MIAPTMAPMKNDFDRICEAFGMNKDGNAGWKVISSWYNNKKDRPTQIRKAMERA